MAVRRSRRDLADREQRAADQQPAVLLHPGARRSGGPRTASTRCRGSFNVSTDGGRTFGPTGGRMFGDHHALWIDPTNPQAAALAAPTAASSSPTTTAATGTSSTTCRWRRPTTSASTWPSRTTSWAASRITRSGAGRTRSGTRSACAKATGCGCATWPTACTPSPTRAIRTSSTTTATSATSRASTCATARSATSSRIRPGPTGGGADARRVPLQLELAGAHVADQSGRAVLRRQRAVQDDRPRRDLDDHQPGPDHERQVEAAWRAAGRSPPTTRAPSSTARSSRSPRARAIPNVIWAGTDDGNVQVTRDGGKTWTNVAPNISGAPRFSWVSSISASSTERRDGVRHDRSAPARRLRAVRVRHDRLRQAPGGESANGLTRLRPRRAGGSEGAEPALSPAPSWASTRRSIAARRWTDLRLGLPPLAVVDL